MPRKTISKYADEIRELYPANTEAEQLTLNRKVSSFVKLLDITIFQAQNEQLPWKEEDLEYTIRPMLLKSKCGDDQVGDYQAYYESPVCSGWVGVLIERKGGKKGCEDLYSTLMNSENCSRFYREIDRFKEDKRFSQMVVIAECSFEQFLLYKPPFIGKTFNKDHIGATVEARRGKIASLYTRGVPVIFAGTRFNAIKIYKALIRQWLIKNYVSILGLDKLVYNDRAFLENRVAQLEAELHAARASLESLDMRTVGELTQEVQA
ncbi:MAG: hypothetical protein WCS17_12365 [Prevotella sp.]